MIGEFPPSNTVFEVPKCMIFANFFTTVSVQSLGRDRIGQSTVNEFGRIRISKTGLSLGIFVYSFIFYFNFLS